MKQQGFTLNFTPLAISHGISLVGSVPDEQNYSSYEGAYTPDYVITPLSLLPWVDILDKDGVLTSGNVNAQLANIKWEEVIGDTVTTITNDTNGYSIITTGGSLRGKLIVSKNIEPDTTITLRFSADYVDTRTLQTIKIQNSYLLSCYSASKSTPTLSLSVADSSLYNPLRDIDTLIIEANMFLGEKGVLANDSVSYVWMVSNDMSSFHSVGYDALDYWASADGNKLTINRQLMGDVVKVRCYGLYENAEVSDATPVKTITITRRIPKYEESIEGGVARLDPTQDSVELALYISDKDGKVDGYEKELLALWYVGATGSDGNADLSTYVGEGAKVKVKTSDMSKTYGGVVGVDIKDRGALKAMANSDGKILTDANGKILVTH